MKKSIFWLCCICSCLSIGCDKAQKQTTKERVIEYHRDGNLNGAVLIVKKDSIICDTVLGYSDFKKKIQLQKETPFYIASLAKPITAIGIMLLEQKQQLSYNDPVSRYLPDSPVNLHKITIQQLLTHTSGIRDYENVLTHTKKITNNDVMVWLKKQKLQFVPGSKYQYSNTGYIVLALIIEKVSGKTMKQFLKENLWEPLKMKHTDVYDGTGNVIPDKAIGFNKDKSLDDYAQLTTGDGGIYSTTGDLYQLDKALRTGLLLNTKNSELMYQLPVLDNGKKGPYGFGWFIENNDSYITTLHTGELFGFRSLFFRDLKNNITIVVLTNQGAAFPVYNFLDEIKENL